MQVIRNLVTVLRLMSAQKPPPPSAGLDLLMAAKPAEGGLAVVGGKEGVGGRGYARREVDYAWECMQKEAQSWLSELLHPGELQGNLRAFQSGRGFFLLRGCPFV